MKSKRVLIVYYSFTQQTRLLLKKFGEGLEQGGVDVAFERLEPVEPYAFPFKTTYGLITAMLGTFFRLRSTIHPINPVCFESWDLIVLAGPTWSFHPSGPILDLLDRYGRKLCAGKVVIPFISCRSYWRFHYWSLKRKLSKCGVAETAAPIVFQHPIREPWRFIGLVLQLRGKMVRKENSWFRRHYPGYGHNREQGNEAQNEGRRVAKQLLADEK